MKNNWILSSATNKNWLNPKGVVTMDKDVKECFDKVDSRFDKLDTRVDKLETKIDRLELRLEKFEFKVDKDLRDTIALLNKVIEKLEVIEDLSVRVTTLEERV